MQPWYSAIPVPAASLPPQDAHCTPVTSNVPSPLSINEVGRSAALPTAPWKRIGPLLCPDEELVVPVPVAPPVPVLGGDVEGAAVVMIVVVVLEPQPAIARPTSNVALRRRLTKRTQSGLEDRR